MAHAAIAFAKASRRRRMMACTTSIGPGATNMVTAAAVAHVNRLPVLLLPGDVFANRRPDPVLQQIEKFSDGTVSANDCFRPVSRYFDRITRPEQIIPALQRAMAVLTDPAECGPVTLALCQDVQAEAYDYPESFFAEQDLDAAPHPPRRGRARARPSALIRKRRRSRFIVAGGGVLYSGAEKALADFAEKHGIPVGETQAGKSQPAARPSANHGRDRRHRHRRRQRARRGGRRGARGRHAPAGFHHRLLGPVQEPGPAHHRPQRAGLRCGQAQRAAAGRRRARRPGGTRRRALGGWKAPDAWTAKAREEKAALVRRQPRATPDPTNAELPSDAQVIGAVQRTSQPTDVVVCAAGGLPGELHKHWKAGAALGYHMEYGYSCMGYEIAGGLGVKMADPDARGHRDGGRRLLSDDEFGDRHLGDARPEADHRGARQSRLRLHQPPAARDRRRELQQPAAAHEPRDLARDRLRRPCGKPRRAGR